MNLIGIKQSVIFIALLTFLSCNSGVSEKEQQARNEIKAETEQLLIAEKLMDNDQVEDAIRITNKIIATSSDNINIGRAYGCQSMVYYYNKNYEKALDFSLKSVSYSEYDIFGARVRALSLFRLGRYSESLPLLKEELEWREYLNLEDSEVNYALGISYYQLGDKLKGC